MEWPHAINETRVGLLTSTLLSRSYVEVESCTSLELHSLASRDLDLLLRLRIDTLTSRLFIYREGTRSRGA